MNDHHLELNRPYQQGDPLDMDDAREASRRVSQLRRDAEATYREAIEARAAKEQQYRAAVAKAIVRLRADNVAATAAAEQARGEEGVKQALIDFRVAEGMVDAYKQRLTGIEGERSMLKSLIDYSTRVATLLGEQREAA